MKKISAKRFMRFFTVLTSTLMAASSVGMTVSASKADLIDAVSNGNIRTANYAKKTTNSVTAGEASISLIGQSVKPGEIAEVSIITDSENKCSCYDVVIEYDARLELEEVIGAKAEVEYEESGRKFVTLIGWTDESNYNDGDALATLRFRVSKNAESGSYAVNFSEVRSFSDDDGNFEGFRFNNTVINVVNESSQSDASLELRNVTGIAGSNAVVQIIPTTNDSCVSFDMLVEYDSRLELDTKDVKGVNAFKIFEQDGKNYVSLVGFTSDVYRDNEPMVALNFHIPADASDEDFDISLAEVRSLSTSSEEITGFSTTDATVSALAASDDYKTYQQYSRSGMLMGSTIGLKGDANCDNKTNVRDAAAVATALANSKSDILTDMGKFLADVNDDGQLNVRDAAKIAKYVAKGSVSWN